MREYRITCAMRVCLFTVGLLLSYQHAAALNSDLRAGAVYIQTDETLGNRVIAFYRDGNGHLTEAGRFFTGGLGTGGGLGQDSAGSVTLGTIGGQQFLFVTNTASNDISVFSVQAHGLTLVSRAPSGGVRPISVTQSGRFVYVVNTITANINGYTVDSNGHLTQIPGSSRSLTLGPAPVTPFHILFDHSGTILAVSDSNTQIIDVYTVDSSTGLSTGPAPNHSDGVEPFGMFFDASNHLLVTEGTFDTPSPLGGTMSSYNLVGNQLQTISAAVKDFRQFACWIAVTTGAASNGGQFVYVSNNGDSTISIYFLQPDGTLALDQQVAAVTGSAPLIGGEDETISSDSAFLYVTSMGGFVNAYAIGPDGALLGIQQVSGLPIGIAGSAGR